MSTSSIHLAEVPIDGTGGLVWNRLHAEREDICEALLKEPVAGSATETVMHDISTADTHDAASWHRDLLQARLRKVDDALDRLMSGSYGNCCKCGRWIEDTKLEFDPAIAFCIGCWERQQRQDEQTSQPGVALRTLSAFDTVWARTHNSNYRIFLLEPRTGRALLEGGQFQEPVEAVVKGSMSGNSAFKVGWIVAGNRMEFWANGMMISTSPVQSFRVERTAPAVSALMSASVVH